MSMGLDTFTARVVLVMKYLSSRRFVVSITSTPSPHCSNKIPNEKRNDFDLWPSNTPGDSSESGPDDKGYTEKLEHPSGARYYYQHRDIEADALPTGTEASHIAEDDGGYHNFQPIAVLQLEDWRKTEKRIVRVLDCTLLPTLWITYLNNYLVLAQAISGLLAYGIFHGMEGAAGLRSWQWFFIVEALMSVVCGVVMFATLPDYPHSRTGSQRWSMGDDERRLAEARIKADRVTGAIGSGTIMDGLKLWLKDVKLYLFTGLNLLMTASYGFNFYFPILVTGLNIVKDNTLALVFTSPPYILGAIVSALVAWNIDRMKERGWHISGGLLASAIGFIMSIASTNTFVRYPASFLFAPGSFAANALVYSWAVSLLSATPEKRAAAGAIVNIVGHVGNIISPYFFRAPEEPSFRTAFILMLVFGALAFANALATKMYRKRQNAKVRTMARETGTVFSPFTL